jgi:hypothetical protein
MRSPAPSNSSRHHIALLLLVGSIALLACGPDASSPIGSPGSAHHDATSENIAPTVTVGTSAGLAAALTPANAGARIHLLAGSYTVSQPLTVPDGAVLEGEGIMQFDDAGHPRGFAAGTKTTLTMAANVPGNVVTLGNGATLRGLAIHDLPGREGSAVGVVSRAPGDRVSAAIAEVEIFNPNPHFNSPLGPTGCGVAVLTLNPNLGGDPPPHDGATLVVSMVGSLIHAPAATSCGLFAFNFAARGDVSVSVADNVIGGGLIANGGVSRTDAVHDASVRIESRRTVYREDYANACSDARSGWNLAGGSGTPIPIALPATERNTLVIHSNGDRIDGFASAVLATGSRRFFNAPIAGPNNGNGIELQMFGTTITAPPCDGVDFKLAAATSTGIYWPGDGNYVHALLRGVTGSGTRANVYGNALVGAAPLPAAVQGHGNRLEIIGSPRSFSATNTGIAPAPGAEFFTATASRP